MSGTGAIVTTVEEALALALGMPGAEQKSHFDNVDVRVGNKIFASFPLPDTMTLRLDPEQARILVASDPETFIPGPGAWGVRGWTRVTLSRIAQDDLADLIDDSWSLVAPKRLRAQRQTRTETGGLP